LRKLRIALGTAESALRAEQENALIESRGEDRKFATAVKKLEDQLSAAEALAETAGGAVTRLRDQIAQLKSELASRRHARCLTATLPIFQALRQKIAEVRSLALEFNHAADHEVSIFDLQETGVDELDKFAAGLDLQILREINGQIGLISHGYTNWHRLLGLKAA
jgi:hypothetical protein